MGRRKNKGLSKFFGFAIVVGYGLTMYMQDQSGSNSAVTKVYTSNGVETRGGPNIGINWPEELGAGDKISENLTQKNYYLVFDGSGSMTNTRCADGSSKMVVAKKAVRQFVSQIDQGANVGLFIFDKYGIKERVPLGIKNREQLIQSIDASSPQGGTPLGSAIKAGIKKLSYQAAKQLGYGEYHLVVITDGEASRNEEPEQFVNYALAETPIIIHTVGFCISDSHSLNQPGKILYKSADNPQALSEGLSSVLAEAEDFVVTDFE